LLADSVHDYTWGRRERFNPGVSETDRAQKERHTSLENGRAIAIDGPVASGKTTVGNVTESIEDEPVATPKVDTKPVEKAEEDDTMDYFNKLASA